MNRRIMLIILICLGISGCAYGVGAAGGSSSFGVGIGAGVAF